MNAKIKSYVRVRKICVAAMMIAAEVVLNRFCSIKTAGWNIGFSFVPVVLTALVYGPGMAAVVGGLADFIGAILFPIGVYHPGFTTGSSCTVQTCIGSLGRMKCALPSGGTRSASGRCSFRHCGTTLFSDCASIPRGSVCFMVLRPTGAGLYTDFRSRRS